VSSIETYKLTLYFHKFLPAMGWTVSPTCSFGKRGRIQQTLRRTKTNKIYLQRSS